MRIDTLRKAVLGLLGLCVASLLPSLAHASEVFPGAIQEYANMPCVPSCLLCHTTNPGNIQSWPGKPFGAFIGTHGALPGNTASLKAAFDAFKADPAHAAMLKALEAGEDPDNGGALCGPTYGCGAHVAKKAPPTDFSAPLWVVGAVAVGGLLRRRRKPDVS